VANYVTNDDEILLRCNNACMYFWHENIFEVAKEDKLIDDVLVSEFITRFDQGTYGYGSIDIDLSETIHSQQMLELLKQLIIKTVEKIKKEKKCVQESIDRFEEFKNKFCALTYNELVKQ
jgi:hypothetical protein